MTIKHKKYAQLHSNKRKANEKDTDTIFHLPDWKICKTLLT